MKTSALETCPDSAEVILFLNGERTPLPKHLHDYVAVYCTDGAFADLKNIPVAGIIGDFDSLNCCHSNGVTDKITIVKADQNYTDFEKALRYIQEQGYRSIDIYWASGGEMDHFLGNLSVVAKYSQMIKIKVYDQYHKYYLASQSITLSAMQDKGITIYPFPNATVSSQGLQYELSRLELTQLKQQSLRNRAIKDTVKLTIESGSVFIFEALQ